MRWVGVWVHACCCFPLLKMLYHAVFPHFFSFSLSLAAFGCRSFSRRARRAGSQTTPMMRTHLTFPSYPAGCTPVSLTSSLVVSPTSGGAQTAPRAVQGSASCRPCGETRRREQKYERIQHQQQGTRGCRARQATPARG